MRKPILLMLATGLLIGCSSRSVSTTTPPQRTGTVVVTEKKPTKTKEKQPAHVVQKKAVKADQKAEKAEAKAEKKAGKTEAKAEKKVEKTEVKAEKKAEKSSAKPAKKAEKASEHPEKGNGKSAHAKSHSPRKLTGVPPGHFPPEGKCRVWHAGRAPGQQPKPTECAKLMGKVPADAFVLYNGKDWDAQYDWSRDKYSVPATIREILLSVKR